MSQRTPGREARREQLQKRRSGGGLRSSEIIEQARLEEEKKVGRGVSPALVGSLAGLAAGGAGLPASIAGLAAGGGQDAIQRTGEEGETEREETFFQRALQGEDFFSLPTSTKASIGKLMQRLNVLEKAGKPWQDRSVQSLVRGIRKLVGGGGLVERETARFERGEPQGAAQPQGTASGAEQQLLSMLDSISKEFLS